jgi:hypothetical protein
MSHVHIVRKGNAMSATAALLRGAAGSLGNVALAVRTPHAVAKTLVDSVGNCAQNDCGAQLIIVEPKSKSVTIPLTLRPNASNCNL